jgi:hypothetical protein
MLALVLLPSLAWGLLHRPEMDYQDSLLAQYAAVGPGEIPARLLEQVQAVVDGLLLDLLQTPALRWVLLPLELIAAGVAGWRFFKLQPDGWFVAAYTALLIVWPYPAEAPRLVWVLLPFLLAYPLWAGNAAAAMLAGRRAFTLEVVRWGIPLTLVLVLVPGFQLAIERRFHPATREYPGIAQLPEWYGVNAAAALASARLHLEVAQAIGELGAQVPEGECVYAVKPPVVTFYAHRVSLTPPNDRVGAELFDAAIRRAGCRYFLLLALASPSYPEPYYPNKRLRGQAELIDTVRTRRDSSGSFVAALARLKPGAPP